jgi:hypothetical protein
MLNDSIHPFDNQVFFGDNWEDDGIVIICIMRITATHLIEEKQLSVFFFFLKWCLLRYVCHSLQLDEYLGCLKV